MRCFADALCTSERRSQTPFPAWFQVQEGQGKALKEVLGRQKRSHFFPPRSWIDWYLRADLWTSPALRQQDQMVRDCVEEQKVFLNPLRVPGWVKIKLTKTDPQEKSTQSVLNFYMDVEPSWKNEPWSSDKSRKLLYLLDKEIIHWWRIDKAEGFGIGVVNGDEVTRKIRWVYQGLLVRISRPLNSPSLQIRPPGTGKVASTWSFRICFQEEEWGKSDASPSLLFSQIPSV